MKRKRLIWAVIFAALAIAAAGALCLLWPRERTPAVGSVMADRIIFLPPPRTTGKTSVEEAISRRRSIRSYADSPLTLDEVRQFLWASQGIY